MQRTWLVLILVGILVGIVGCTSSRDPSGGSEYAVASCADDGTCRAGACTAGLCLTPCAADSDCPAGAVCLDGACYADRSTACTADSDCAAGEHCAGGVCGGLPPVLSCAADADCPAGTGCVAGECVSDPARGCDPARPAGTEVCGNGVDDDCDGAVDEDCDPSRACTADADCRTGGVALSCCGGMCIDASSDPMHCGACGAVCPAGTACTAGVCERSTGGCASDSDCAPSEVCVSGVCTSSGTCTPAPEACGNGVDDDCDGAVDEGCDPTTACSADADCARGGVALWCCGGACADLNTDFYNCGACGAVCGAGERCDAGACTR